MIVRAVRALLCVRSGAPVPFVRALPPPLGGARTHERTRTGAKRKGPGTWPGPSCLVDGYRPESASLVTWKPSQTPPQSSGSK
jgi:hypothetical protein